MELKLKIVKGEDYLEVEARKMFNSEWNIEARVCVGLFPDNRKFHEKALELVEEARERLAEILSAVEKKLREDRDEG